MVSHNKPGFQAVYPAAGQRALPHLQAGAMRLLIMQQFPSANCNGLDDVLGVGEGSHTVAGRYPCRATTQLLNRLHGMAQKK